MEAAAAVVSMVTLADTSPLAAAAALAAAGAAPSGFEADWAERSVGTTSTSGAAAAEDVDCWGNIHI